MSAVGAFSNFGATALNLAGAAAVTKESVKMLRGAKRTARERRNPETKHKKHGMEKFML